MPIYEYECAKCQNDFEVEQRITDDPIKTCPRCRSRRVKRLISRTSFVLKGGGWYSDLYSSPSDKGGKSAESEGGGASDAAESKDSASKSDAKSDAKSADKGKSKPKTPKKDSKAVA